MSHLATSQVLAFLLGSARSQRFSARHRISKVSRPCQAKSSIKVARIFSLLEAHKSMGNSVALCRGP